MNDDFYKQIFESQRCEKSIPLNAVVAEWALNVVHLLYPQHCKNLFASVEELKQQASLLQSELSSFILACSNFEAPHCNQLANQFFDHLPFLYQTLNTDISAIYHGDPAARTQFEVIRTYPGFYAISFYRIAHVLFGFDIPLLPRILTEHAHSKTGIDIHPAAIIGEYFHIDHGTGIVIGETSSIGRNVKIYQGVTLGALSVRKDLAGKKRHPTVGDRVVIYSGATILGGDTIIGDDSVIGGNVWLTKSVPPHSKVYHNPMISVLNILENI
jgi:serine O-acetyltransferase